MNLLEKGNRAADISGIEGVAGDTDYDATGGLSGDNSLVPTGDSASNLHTGTSSSSFAGEYQGSGSADANALSAIAQLASSQLASQPASAATAQLFQSLMNLKANFNLQNASNAGNNFQQNFNSPWTPVGVGRDSDTDKNQASGPGWSGGNTLGPSKPSVS